MQYTQDAGAEGPALDTDLPRLFHAGVEATSDSIIITAADLDRPGPTILYVNPAFEQMTGYDAGEVVGQSPRILQGADSDPQALRAMRASLDRGESFRGNIVNYRKDGSRYHAEWLVSPIRDAAGRITHFVSLQRDVTETLRQQRDRELLVGALEEIADEVVITDIDGRINYVNRAYRDRTGTASQDAARGRYATPFAPGRLSPEALAKLKRTVSAGRTHSVAFRETDRDGEPLYLEYSVAPVRACDGSVQQYVLTGRDVSDRVAAERELKHMATTDRLTGLHNRMRFEAILQQCLRRSRDTGEPSSLIMLDIDAFKAINDHFGHQAGDDVLVAIGELLRAHCRSADRAGRWGGEEFMLILPATRLDAGETLASRLRTLLEASCMPHVGRVTASLGVTETTPTDTINSLVQRVDCALYQAKTRGRNRVQTIRADSANDTD